MQGYRTQGYPPNFGPFGFLQHPQEGSNFKLEDTRLDSWTGCEFLYPPLEKVPALLPEKQTERLVYKHTPRRGPKTVMEYTAAERWVGMRWHALPKGITPPSKANLPFGTAMWLGRLVSRCNVTFALNGQRLVVADFARAKTVH